MHDRKHATEVLKALPPEARQQIRAWCRADDRDPVVRRANLVTQIKILTVYAGFALTLVAYLATGGSWLVAVPSAVLLGGFLLPLLCSYMHSHAHWGVGNGPVVNWILDHGLGLLYGLPQTGYKYGHDAHHRYDNDFDPRGLPKDMQSTYIFSTNGRPTNLWKYIAFFIIVYQHAIHLFHVLNSGKRRQLAWYVAEYVLIVAFNVGLCWLSPGYYLTVYLPSLLYAWVEVAICLYMMHAVDLHDFKVHPSLNTRNWLFNTLADNVGYHVEHSLYPAVHAVYLQEASDLIKPPAEQVIDEQYMTEAIRRILRGQHV